MDKLKRDALKVFVEIVNTCYRLRSVTKIIDFCNAPIHVRSRRTL